MAVPITNLTYNRVLDQIMNNLITLQRDMANNAQTHKAMAQAGSPPVGTLATFLNDSAAAYLTRIQWGKDIVNTTPKLNALTATLGRIGLLMADLTDISSVLETESNALASATKNNYTQIITACDRVITNVELPPSLWPE